MSPFDPVGDRARWRVIYDMLVKVPTGGILTYEAMGKELGLDPDSDRHTIQMAVRRAAREHEVCDSRALDSVPNTGYKVVHAPEHLDLARRHQRKAGRSLERGRSKVEHVDLADLDDATQHAFRIVAQAFALQADFNRRLDIRQKKLERQVQSAMSVQQHTADELTELRARLERLESERDT